MKTAVEWFAERIQSDKIFNFETVLSKANKMFEEQIKEAWVDGVTNWDSEKEVEDYINETFKSE
jgi:predicted ABC-type ATPase